jgi:hypothetical protein
MSEVVLGIWEDTPMVLVKGDGGEVSGYAWIGGEWIAGYAEEAMTKARVLSPEEFAKVFPGIEPPR